MTATGLAVRPLVPSDEAAVLELLAAALAGGPTGVRSADFFRWKHRASPFGASPGMVALDGDRVVGVRLFLRWDLSWGGRPVRAVRAVDTATHPSYQRRGIFRALTLALLDQLEREGVVLVFNTPNAASRPGYLRMGWHPVGTLPVRVRPVRPARFLAGLRGARSANATGTADDLAPAPARLQPCRLPRAAEVLADPEVETLLRSRQRASGLHTHLTPTYLRWRYAQAPGLDYRAVTVRRRGRLVGLGIGRVRARAALTELTLGEVLVGAGDRQAARAVLAGARRSGVDHVTLHATPGSEAAAAARTGGYVRAPRTGIGLVANPRPGCPPGILDLDNWQLSLGDLEVF